MPPRTPGNFLQVVFSFFLGLIVVAFVGIGMATFYPAPKTPEWSEYGRAADWAQWHLMTSIIALGLATLIMVLSLIRSEAIPVVSNGLLLGGLFTVVYASIMTMTGEIKWPNFAVITAALVISVAMGYLKFVRSARQRGQAPAESVVVPGELDARLSAVEAKLEALGHALRD